MATSLARHGAHSSALARITACALMLLAGVSAATAQTFDPATRIYFANPYGGSGTRLRVASHFGNVYLAWEDYVGGNGFTIQFSYSSGLTAWTFPFTVIGSGQDPQYYDRDPAVVSSPEDDPALVPAVYVGYMFAGDVYVRRNTLGGDSAGWHDHVGVDAGDQPDMAVSRRPAPGQPYVLYVAYKSHFDLPLDTIFVKRSFDEGASFEGDSGGTFITHVISSGVATDGVDLSTVNCTNPGIAAGEGMDLHAVFDCAASPTPRGYYRRSRDGGVNWERPIALGVSSSRPSVATCGSRVYVVWTEAPGEIRLGRSLDGGATFQTPVAVTPGAAGTETPDLAVADNEVYVTWSTTAHDVQYRRSVDGGATFVEPVTLLGTGDIQPAPHLTRTPDRVVAAFISAFNVYARQSDTAVGLTCSCLGPPVPGLDVALDNDGTTSVVTWSSVPGARAFNSYSGEIVAGGFGLNPGGPYDHVCLEAADAQADGATRSLDPQMPPAGDARYYLAAITGRCGQGGLGTSSAGVPRPNPAPCP